jgi:hypothetical protein
LHGGILAGAGPVTIFDSGMVATGHLRRPRATFGFISFGTKKFHVAENKELKNSFFSNSALGTVSALISVQAALQDAGNKTKGRVV